MSSSTSVKQFAVMPILITGVFPFKPERFQPYRANQAVFIYEQCSQSSKPLNLYDRGLSICFQALAV
jgi:hypothetical protein